MYVKVVDGIAVEVVAKPNWIENGAPASDAFLISRGVYPIVDNLPIIDSFYQTCKWDLLSTWTILEDSVLPSYIIESQSLEQVLQKQLSLLSSVRYKYECGGMQFTLSTTKQLKMHTDRDSQSTIIGKFTAVQAGLVPGDILFKCIDEWKALNNAEVIEIATLVAINVQNCFIREKAISDIYKACMSISDLKVAVAAELYFGWPEFCLWQP